MTDLYYCHELWLQITLLIFKYIYQAYKFMTVLLLDVLRVYELKYISFGFYWYEPSRYKVHFDLNNIIVS